MPPTLENPPLTRDELTADLCRPHMRRFVRKFWGTVPGAGNLVWNWHMDVLCWELQKIANRIKAWQPAEYDLVINIPPGTSKSSICSILFQPWFWADYPQARFINATHTHDLVMSFADKSLQVMQSDLYRRVFPHVQLRKSATGSFANMAGGDRLAATVGGKSPMGFHAHVLTGDDLIDPERAMSELELQTARQFVENYLPTRVVDKQVSALMLVMQRLGRGDPTDVMLENGKKEGSRPVRWICLPCDDSWDIHPRDELFPFPDEQGRIRWQTLPEKYVEGGGLLDPRRLPRVVLKAFSAKGEFYYASQFGQCPVPRGGAMFKADWFKNIVPSAPYHVKKRVRAWDRASTLDGGCYTAGVLLSLATDGFWYVEHCEHGQWEPVERNARIKAAAHRDASRYGPKGVPTIIIERETGSTGKESFQNIVRELQEYHVIEDAPTGKKDERAAPWAGKLASGLVRLVDDGTWDVHGYIQEHIAFRPDVTSKRLGKWKDRVDATSLGHNWIARKTRPGMILRSFQLRPRKPGQYRIVVCSLEELELLTSDEKALLVTFNEPTTAENTQPPSHTLSNLQATLQLVFADLDPADVQETWNEPLEPYGKPPAEVIMTPEHGRKLWAFVLKQRPDKHDLLVLADEGNRIARTVATAICDNLRLVRKDTVWDENPETLPNSNDNKGREENPHVAAILKSTRGTVIG